MLHDTSRPTQNEPRHTDQSKQANTFIRNWLNRMLFETKTPTFQIVVVTPELAAMMLEKNTHNRVITRSHVEQLAAQMSAETFRDTPQPISFDRNGRLLDGQHRLMAIIESGADVKLRVFFGEDPDIFSVMDTGRKRTAGDTLSIIGVENASNMAALIRCELAISRGVLSRTGGFPISTQDVLTTMSSPEFAFAQDAVRLQKSLVRSAGVLKTNAGFGVAMLRILRVNDQQIVRLFVEKITHGLNISSPSDPVARLRSRMMTPITNTVETAAITIKVWNAEVRQASIGVLRWAPPEKFPTALSIAG